MINLYADYIKELCGMELHYCDEYFYTYKLYDNYIYLENVYIIPEKRGNKISQTILEEMFNLAKEFDKKYVTSSINKNCGELILNRSGHILESNGFSLYDEDNNLKYYSKEIK